MSAPKLFLLTLCVLIAFAANSVLGRAALKASDTILIDPATYTTVRIFFGALSLVLIQFFRRPKPRAEQITDGPRLSSKRLAAAVALFLYALCFSFAYIRLNAAMGTLILFAGVQFTMLIGASIRGETLRAADVFGSVIAFSGLAWLLSPSIQDAELRLEAVLMLLSGISWGVYSLIGKGSEDPISDTATNFAIATPMAIAFSSLLIRQFQCSLSGFALAAISGAITSGLGYVLWYTVLPRLSGALAAAVQLSVPIIAGIGGVIFAGDRLSGRTVVAAAIILTGIAFTIRWKTGGNSPTATNDK